MIITLCNHKTLKDMSLLFFKEKKIVAAHSAFILIRKLKKMLKKN